MNFLQAVLIVLLVFQILVTGATIGTTTYEYTLYRNYDVLNGITDMYLGFLIVLCVLMGVSVLGIIPAIFWPTLMDCFGLLFIILSLGRFAVGLSAHVLLTCAIHNKQDYHLPPELHLNEEGHEKDIYKSVQALAYTGIIGDGLTIIMLLATGVACFLTGQHTRKVATQAKEREAIQKKLLEAQEQQKLIPQRSYPRKPAQTHKRQPSNR